MTLRIEIFSAPGCNKCAHARQLVETVIRSIDKGPVDLRIINVVDELDYAVELGVRATPSIAINGVLVFTCLPSEQRLREQLVSAC